ncbi:MAG: ammonium transporter [Clostridiales Family XIII bacterium]|jgi:Amt family ammonium transporter|nr:ammonium transporter [Clostridiales Family XIII bacterium]
MFSGSDTAWVMISGALVLFMTPGLAFFYGGLGRRKNVISTMTNSVFNLGIGTLSWIAIGYTLVCGGSGPIIASFKFPFMSGIGVDDMTGSVSTYTYSFLMCMYALITPAIITGSVAGRMRHKAIYIFVALWSILVYYPLAHMVWGDGGLLGLSETSWLGAADFAGGNVVHISSGVSGLVLCILVGKRRGYSQLSYRPHNIPFVLIGLGILWFGWFGFNGGSALGASNLTGHVLLSTMVAGGIAMFSWMLIDVIRTGKPTLIGGCTGALAGLVGITPGCGFMPLWVAVLVGLLVSPACYFGIILVKSILKIDDSFDAFGCHGIGGIFGGIITGFFAESSIGGVDGMFYGDPAQLGRQVIAIVISIAWAVGGTLICAGVTRIFTPLRVEAKEESIGLDSVLHGESAYPSYTGLD